MPLPFSHSLRALHADHHRFALAAFLAGIGLLTAWASWFFLARITLYETGRLVEMTRRGTIVAELPAGAVGKVRPGQPARIHLQSARLNQRAILPGTIMHVTKHPDQDRVELRIPQNMAASLNWREPLTGAVDIAVDSVSPATLLTQSTGPFFKPPAAPGNSVSR